MAPPPPPMLFPLETGSLVCVNFSLPEGTSRPALVVMGGSNTQGANAISVSSRGGTTYGWPHHSFAKILSHTLRASHSTLWNADGGKLTMREGRAPHARGVCSVACVALRMQPLDCRCPLPPGCVHRLRPVESGLVCESLRAARDTHRHHRVPAKQYMRRLRSTPHVGMRIVDCSTQHSTHAPVLVSCSRLEYSLRP